MKRGIRNIITVTSCIPGMSGDDLVPLQKELKSLGVDMYIIHTDGIEAGDYNEGMALCYKTLALQAVDPNVKQNLTASILSMNIQFLLRQIVLL